MGQPSGVTSSDGTHSPANAVHTTPTTLATQAGVVTTCNASKDASRHRNRTATSLLQAGSQKERTTAIHTERTQAHKHRVSNDDPLDSCARVLSASASLLPRHYVPRCSSNRCCDAEVRHQHHRRR